MIKNMTPHPVIILDGDYRQIARYESSGQVRLASKTVQADPIEGIATSQTVFGAPEGLPDCKTGTYYIVSQLIKSALPSRVDLLVPAEVVRDGSGNIIGCQSLGR